MRRYKFTDQDNFETYFKNYQKNEFEEYLKETGKKLEYNNVDERFKHCNDSEKCLSEAIEYCGRSIIPRPWQKFLGDQFIEMMKKTDKCLDYGCGAGNIGIYLLENGLCCDFIDIKGEITQFVEWRLKKRNLKANVYWHTDCEKLKPEYDLVFMVNVLEHLKDPIMVIKNIHRILKSGGYFYYQWSTQEIGLDLLTHSRYNKTIFPLIKSLFKIQDEKDERLWIKP